MLLKFVGYNPKSIQRIYNIKNIRRYKYSKMNNVSFYLRKSKKKFNLSLKKAKENK